MPDEEEIFVAAPIQIEECTGLDTSRVNANDFDGSFLKVAEFEDVSKKDDHSENTDDDCLIAKPEIHIDGPSEKSSSFVGQRNKTLEAYKVKQNKRMEMANTESMIAKMNDLEMKVYQLESEKAGLESTIVKMQEELVGSKE